MNELISVIVPVYNVEKYLKKCVNSIIAQTYKNLEIILVNDGSTDNSPQICDEIAKTDSRIKVIHKENGGLSDARNTGIDVATGDYIGFIDSDDYIHEKMYETLYNKMLCDKSDMALCNYLYVDENGNEIIEENFGAPLQDMCLSKKDMLANLYCDLYHYYIIACNKLYKKSLFEDIRFPKGKLYEDECIAHYIIDNCDKISTVKDSLLYYVQRSGSITNNGYSSKNLQQAYPFFDRAEFFIKRNDYAGAASVMLTVQYIISKGYALLDKSNRQEIKSQLKLYNSIYKKIKLADIAPKKRLLLLLFRINPKLYYYIVKFYKIALKRR